MIQQKKTKKTNLLKIAEEIVQKEKKDLVVTSVPQDDIDEALKLAFQLRQFVDGIASEIDLAIENLQGESSPSVLESKDDFNSLVLKLKQMKRKLTLV